MNDRLRLLVDRLTEATRANSVVWEFIMSDVYRTKAGGSYVTVGHDYSNGFGVEAWIRLTNPRGQVVEDTMVRSMNNHEEYERLKSLFDAAKECALNSQDVIDDILAAIGGK